MTTVLVILGIVAFLFVLMFLNKSKATNEVPALARQKEQQLESVVNEIHNHGFNEDRIKRVCGTLFSSLYYNLRLDWIKKGRNDIAFHFKNTAAKSVYNAQAEIVVHEAMDFLRDPYNQADFEGSFVKITEMYSAYYTPIMALSIREMGV